MLDFIFGKKRNAQPLHDAARAIKDEGNDEQAIALHQQAVEADPESHYNIGLIYKYRNAWPKSFEYNRRANALDLDDDMWQVRRHIGIAAPTQEAIHTVLRSWTGPGASSWELTCCLPARQL